MVTQKHTHLWFYSPFLESYTLKNCPFITRSSEKFSEAASYYLN